MSQNVQKTLTLAALVLALIVIGLGAYTRLVDAGLGCPDWPGCYGFLSIPVDGDEIATANERFPEAPFEREKAVPEVVHRVAAGTLGLFIVAIAFVAWRTRDALALPLAMVVLVIVQGAFGAWTVTLKLWPQVVTAHLLGGFATLALLWIYALKQDYAPIRWRGFRSQHDDHTEFKWLRHTVHGTLALLVFQIAIGGWVTSNYAGLACPDFPTCHGEWVPEMDFASGFDIMQAVGPNYLGGNLSSDARVAIQWVHRIGALLVTLAVGLVVFGLKSNRARLAISFLLVTQIILGMWNIWGNLPLYIAVLHNLGAVLLLLGLLTVMLELREHTKDKLTQ